MVRELKKFIKQVLSLVFLRTSNNYLEKLERPLKYFFTFYSIYFNILPLSTNNYGIINS